MMTLKENKNKKQASETNHTQKLCIVKETTE